MSKRQNSNLDQPRGEDAVAFWAWYALLVLHRGPAAVNTS